MTTSSPVAIAQKTKASSSAPSAVWQIVHHIPGRMRLRLPVGLEIGGALQQHLDQLEQLAGVRSARLNRAAQSIAITYLPTV
ncbi:MAG: hypothetical protein AAGF75_06845, partial [Cyanobacteria bacterium P01_H01_bin.130]